VKNREILNYRHLATKNFTISKSQNDGKFLAKKTYSFTHFYVLGASDIELFSAYFILLLNKLERFKLEKHSNPFLFINYRYVKDYSKARYLLPESARSLVVLEPSSARGLLVLGAC